MSCQCAITPTKARRSVAAKHRIEEPDIVQMRAAGVRIVVQEEIAGPDVAAILLRRARAPTTAAPKSAWADRARMRRPDRPRASGRREEKSWPSMIIARVRGANDDGAHLAHDRGKPRLHQLDGDRIERLTWSTMMIDSRDRTGGTDEATRSSQGIGGRTGRICHSGNRAGAAKARARAAAAGVRARHPRSGDRGVHVDPAGDAGLRRAEDRALDRDPHW